MPQVTIIIPVLNRVKLLLESINSLIDQSFSDFDVLFIDDGSDETTISQIEKKIKNNPNFRFIQNNNNTSGASACRNQGIKEASSELIIFLDSDDLLAPHCLEQRITIMDENPELDFAVFPMFIFNTKPGNTNLLWNRQTEESDLNRFLRLDSVWQTTGPIWRKSALERIGGFDESLACWQDVDIHLKALFAGLNYKVFENNIPDAYYRKHLEGSISQENLNSPEKVNSRLRLFYWAYNRLEKNNLHISEYPGIKEMLLGILFSMGTTIKVKSVLKTLSKNEVKKLLSINEKISILKHAFIYITGIYKIKPYLSSHLDSISKHFTPKYVGKFTY